MCDFACNLKDDYITRLKSLCLLTWTPTTDSYSMIITLYFTIVVALLGVFFFLPMGKSLVK